MMDTAIPVRKAIQMKSKIIRLLIYPGILLQTPSSSDSISSA